MAIEKISLDEIKSCQSAIEVENKLSKAQSIIDELAIGFMDEALSIQGKSTQPSPSDTHQRILKNIEVIKKNRAKLSTIPSFEEYFEKMQKQGLSPNEIATKYIQRLAKYCKQGKEIMEMPEQQLKALVKENDFNANNIN